MPDSAPEAIRDALRTVSTGRPLTPEAAEAFMAAVLDGEVTPAQLGGMLVGMHARGETAAELAAPHATRGSSRDHLWRAAQARP